MFECLPEKILVYHSIIGSGSLVMEGAFSARQSVKVMIHNKRSQEDGHPRCHNESLKE